MLNPELLERFWNDGYLVAAGAVTESQLDALNGQLAAWIEESREHAAPYGSPTLDGKARFDLGARHRRDLPALRRVNNPSEISDAYLDVIRDAPLVDMVADLIGPDVKFHHCKINLKLPGTDTEVGYHQDFAYTPHTNDDIVTALLMLDDMTEENGCLTVVPGSHLGPLHSLFDGDRFTGAMPVETVARLQAREVSLTGAAGSVCLMHTRLAHGSAANRSPKPRGLFIAVYTAADAFPIAPSPLPNAHEGMIVRGQATRVARLMEASVELPPRWQAASFFAVQGQRSATVAETGLSA